MKTEQLAQLREWFADYVRRFYGTDDYVNFNLKLKEDHTYRVCDEMLYLADQLGLDEDRKLLAETVALLHDIGRFEQFVKYRTYHDPRSLNHCSFGVKILRDNKILDSLPACEARTIEQAVEFHGIKQLPDHLDGDALLLARMIRDADKLDIYHIVTYGYKQLRDDPKNFKFEIELPDTPEYSREILESVIAGRRVDYKLLRTWNDMKLCELGWVYDVNFAPTLKRIRDREYIEQVLEFLPNNPDIQRAASAVFAYIDGAE